MNDSSLWEKKKIKKKDEKTGEEIEAEDYDWDKITKAVKSFVEDYNDVVKKAGESNTKDVLRNASWMTGMTDKNSNMLAKIGITIGKGNKLELDEDALKQADISSLKTVFGANNTDAIINSTDLLIIPLNKNNIEGIIESANALKTLFFLKHIIQIAQ